MSQLMPGVAKDEAATTSKGERTRERILQTALGMFLEQGYDKTTMRAIAKGAGVSVGNAYYYFKSKEHLIQAFYGFMHRQHVAATQELLDQESDFKQRLGESIRLFIDIAQPYHEFSGALFRTAADPRSPLNPFSRESEPARQESVGLFARVIDGSDTRFPGDLKDELPYLLWLYHMGIVLFWIFDHSPERRRTYKLLDATVDLVVKLILVTKLPPMRPLVRSALNLLRELREDREVA